MSNYPYEIAISFAEEDRNIAVALACGFKLKDIKAYYYPDHKAATLGSNLASELQRIYHEKAQYAVIVLSKNYPNKTYCKIEAEAILHRLQGQDKRYVVVVKTDDTLPIDIGLPKGLCYEKWDYNPEEIAEALFDILGKEEKLPEKPLSDQPTQNTHINFNGSINARDVIGQQTNYWDKDERG